jgi:hypothetical protein
MYQNYNGHTFCFGDESYIDSDEDKSSDDTSFPDQLQILAKRVAAESENPR